MIMDQARLLVNHYPSTLRHQAARKMAVMEHNLATIAGPEPFEV